MVDFNSKWLGYQPKPCLARPMLHAALRAHDAGQFVIAAIRLREAAMRFLQSACEYYNCTPKRVKFNRPSDFINALRKAGVIDKWGAKSFLRAIECGNRAAHCRPIDAAVVRSYIGIMFGMLDGEPYAIDEVRFPVAVDDDCDCDDDGDGWKAGAL